MSIKRSERLPFRLFLFNIKKMQRERDELWTTSDDTVPGSWWEQAPFHIKVCAMSAI